MQLSIQASFSLLLEPSDHNTTHHVESFVRDDPHVSRRKLGQRLVEDTAVLPHRVPAGVERQLTRRT